MPDAAIRDVAGHMLVRLLQRIAAVTGVLVIIGLMPWGGPLGPVKVKQALMTFLAIAGIGKALYDTLYYERYRC